MLLHTDRAWCTVCTSKHFLFPVGLECEKLTDFFSKKSVVKALRTPLASMQYGNEDFLADLVAEACSECEHRLEVCLGGRGPPQPLSEAL